jgi:alpha-N-arabinofuranosidase
MRALAVLLAATALTGCAALSPPSTPAPGEARFAWMSYRGEDPVDRAQVAGPDEYRNPILSGFYPDPSIARAGDDYYLVTSTFAWFPGIPVFHSRDLVNWRQIGAAISRPEQLDFKDLGLSRGVFAPTIEHRDGVFYILNTCVDCGGNFILTAKDPAGPWSDPVWLPEVGGIDPSLAFDVDGAAWILNNDAPPGEPKYDGHRAIWIRPFDLKTLKVIGPQTLLVDGGVDPSTKPIWIEGPHIYRVDGWYYLTAAEGGTAEGHSQVALRSRSITGPYVPGPNNPFLTQRDLPRDRAHPITSAGHADLVQTPKGDWWATFLAVRPYEGDFYNTGRETFLMRVTWVDGWPVMTRPGETIPYVAKRPDLPQDRRPGDVQSGAFDWREEFDRPLGLDWLSPRKPAVWSRLEGGELVLRAQADGLGSGRRPAFLARRQQHANAVAQTEVLPTADGVAAGLAAFQSDDFWYLVAVEAEAGRRVVRLRRKAGAGEPAAGTVLAEAPLTRAGPVRLRAAARGDAYDFAFAERGGDWRTLAADQDGKLLSTRVAGGFVGAVFGLYAGPVKP